MESFSFVEDDDDFDRAYRHHQQIELLPEDNYKRLYFVPYRWWNDAQESLFRDSGKIEGLLYALFEVNIDDSKSEILLNLRRDDTEKCGRTGDCALVSEMMFLQAIQWHNRAENNAPELFSLKIGLSTSLVVRISQKDNQVTAFNRAYDCFCAEYGLLSIWDFSGKITPIFKNNKINDGSQTDAEILLELQVYGFSYCTRARKRRKVELAEQSKSDEGSSRDCVLGLAGLYNLGNTCYMNSAIQCLVHTPELVDYFSGDYTKDIQTKNSSGTNGDLAVAFGNLLEKVWAPGSATVTTSSLKKILNQFAPQFCGRAQHDSQEFLSFLLGGLHDDLNLVKCKPYIESKDAESRPDKEAAEEHWQNHLAREDSIIVHLCQGQYRSTVTCSSCKKKSTTFDLFMNLSLPLPSITLRQMTLTILSTDGTTLPFTVTVTVPKYGKFRDLFQALSSECSLRDDETFLVAEIFNNHIKYFLDKSSDSIQLISVDQLVAYRLPKDSETSHLVVFNHELLETEIRGTSSCKKFGVPLVTRISDLSRGSEIHKQFLKLLKPFILPGKSYDIPFEMEHIDHSHLGSNFQFHLMEEGGLFPKDSQIQMHEPVQISELPYIIYVLVSWPSEMVELYDTKLLSTIPKINKLGLVTRKPQESVSLSACLEDFLKEESLGPGNKWYCPKCKKVQQASKKLDLWRLPTILVFHLKRFSYNPNLTNKLETFVDFPIDRLDLSSYIVCKDSGVAHHYMFYAVSNHFGGMDSGHYTAFVRNK